MNLISWNIQWCRGVDGRVDPERIARTLRELAPEADVICLQEVARGFDTLKGSGGEDQFALLAAAFPGFTAIDGIAVDVPHPRGGRRQFGNLLLSRLPAAPGEPPPACPGRPTPIMKTCRASPSRP